MTTKQGAGSSGVSDRSPMQTFFLARLQHLMEQRGRYANLVGPERWGEPLRAPGGDVVAARPREAFLQLVDRERTYFSNVPVETPVSRVCRALIRLGVMDRIHS